MADIGEIDVPNWYARGTVPVPDRPPLAQDADVDVCVIGGGLAGLTIARETARRGWSVLVLEGKKIAWNASGRNAGLVAPGFSERIENIVERVGLARAKELWALSAAGVEYVRAAIRDTGTAGGCGACWRGHVITSATAPSTAASFATLSQRIRRHQGTGALVLAPGGSPRVGIVAGSHGPSLRVTPRSPMLSILYHLLRDHGHSMSCAELCLRFF